MIPLGSPSGDLVYAKGGKFALNGDGTLVSMSEKFPLMAYAIDSAGIVSSTLAAVSLNALNKFSVKEDGRVVTEAFVPGVPPARGEFKSITIAQIPVALFQDESHLSAIGGGMFQPSQGSGAATLGTASTGGRGEVMRGSLLSANEPMTFSVGGNGYLLLESKDGDIIYARFAKMILTSGRLNTINDGSSILGYAINEAGNISATLSSISLNSLAKYVFQRDGTVIEIWEGIEPRAIAKIPLASFQGDDFLTSLGKGRFQESSNSGFARISMPEIAGLGEVITK